MQKPFEKPKPIFGAGGTPKLKGVGEIWYVEQRGKLGGWIIRGPFCKSPEAAVRAWNKLPAQRR